DRYFVDQLAPKVIEVGDGEALVYPGGYEDFLYWKKQREAGVAVPLPAAHHPASHLKADGRPAAAPAAAPVSAAPRPAPPPARANKGAPKAAPPTTGNGGRPAYDPLAPRLRPSAATGDDRQAREREARKLKARAAELEKRIGEKEQAVRDLEHLMATPGFYEDRSKADQAVADRQRLLSEVGTLMGEWESVQANLET
ncbi:MAG TPA: hypothetical protein VMR21_09595, partial [Vicinamibacteria bacterium]|nr:hypothetical protein [Vicinamibacteria bacterium]